MVFGGLLLENKYSLSDALCNLFNSHFTDYQSTKRRFGNLDSIWTTSNRLPYIEDSFLWVDENAGVLTFLNGNIYSELDNPNPGEKSILTKAELVYNLFVKQGPDFVNQLNGDFVIIIYESRKDNLYVFRDHLGIIPLSYIVINDSLVYSTDIIQLCRLFQEGNSLNSEFFLSEFRFADLTQTPNPKVKKLLPGHYLKFSKGDLEMIKYWKPEKIKTNHKLKKQQVYDHFKYLIEDTIRIRSDKRYKAAAHVSGGLDSSVIAALVRKEYAGQKTFLGYSWSPENFEPVKVEFDERNLVRKTCDMNDIKPVFIDLHLDDYLVRAKNYIRNFGAFAEEKILEHANNEDINLIFSGWGGDEFISKGERGINTDLLLNLNLALFFKKNSIFNPKRFIKTILYDILFPAINLVNLNQARSHKQFTRYLKHPYYKNYLPSVKKFLFYRSRRKLHLGFLYYYHISNRTEFSYIQGFLHGVEYRYPLLDKRIVEYMLTVPTKCLVDGAYSRMILREISKGLVPEEVTWIRKGIDPVYQNSLYRNSLKASKIFVNMLDEYEANSDLYFINFDLLKKDLEIFRENNKYPEEFIANMVIINSIHEFSICYRSKNSMAS